MNRAARIMLAAMLLLAGCNEAAEPADTAGEAAPTTTTAPARARPFAWEMHTETFVDVSRPTTNAEGLELAPDRTLETDVYVPEGAGPYPLIAFAHGARGHPRKFTQLFESWATAGYVVAAPAFPLTNDQADVFVLGDVVHQPADVSYVMTQVLDLVDVADPERIGVAGLSLGGVTTYGVAFHSCCRDPRIDALIVMSGARLPFEGEYTFDEKPFLIMHGTADPTIPFTEAEAAFAQVASPKFFVTLEEGSHSSPYEDSPSPHDEVVRVVSLDFWDAYLVNDSAAADRIVTDGTVERVAHAQAVP